MIDPMVEVICILFAFVLGIFIGFIWRPKETGKDHAKPDDTQNLMNDMQKGIEDQEALDNLQKRMRSVERDIYKHSKEVANKPNSYLKEVSIKNDGSDVVIWKDTKLETMYNDMLHLTQVTWNLLDLVHRIEEHNR